MDNRLTDLSHPAVAAHRRSLKRRAQSSVVSDFSSALSAALCHIHSCLHKAEGYL